jgi:type IV fimbrial biogenesis protein FimT
MKRSASKTKPVPKGPTARAEGFTLIELLVVLILLSVMLTLAAPSFMTFQRNAELTSAANSFTASLSTARAEAMKRQLPAFVIPTAGSTNWASGWRVFVDVDRSSLSGTVAPAGNDLVVAEQDALQSTLGVTSSSFPSAGGTEYVMFNGNGSMTDVGGTFANRSIVFSNGTESRRVVANPTGRLRVCKPADSGCGEGDL